MEVAQAYAEKAILKAASANYSSSMSKKSVTVVDPKGGIAVEPGKKKRYVAVRHLYLVGRAYGGCPRQRPDVFLSCCWEVEGGIVSGYAGSASRTFAASEAWNLPLLCHCCTLSIVIFRFLCRHN